MNRTFIYLILITFVMSTACNSTKQNNENPLLSEFNTPFGVPPFQDIKVQHFLPAYKQAIAEQNKAIEAIVNNNETPTFENTIIALEYSDESLSKISQIFSNQSSADTNEELQEAAKEIIPMVSKHEDQIFLNAQLFEKVKSVYDQAAELTLDEEAAKLLQETYKDFVRRGANLEDAQKEKLQKINERLSVLSLEFGENLLAETNNYQLTITNEADLAGLPESAIESAAEAAGEEGKWVITLHKPSWIPFLQYSEKRNLREHVYKAMYNRGNNNNEFDNKAIIAEMAKLRVEKAHIMGFDSYADYSLDNRMAKTPQNVYDLLDKLWVPALEMAKNEAADMQKMIDKEGGNFKLESWDWWYYSEKVRKEKFDLDEAELRPYFELNNVRDGAFTLANKLFGLQFAEINDIPVPHNEARAFEVKDADGSHIGILYTDYFPRASKRGGAWMNSYRKQQKTIDGKWVAPVITNVCNFSKPIGNKPALLSFDEVTTLFHEFGHALHGLLSECNYYSLSGTSVPRDFVELPSQVMENWCAEPEMLKLFAKHYETGEVIPQQLIDKLLAASQFNQGFATVEYLAASILDMDYHTVSEVKDFDIEAFEKQSMNKIGLIDEIIPRYKSTYFNHIWASGYSAGYYSYIWAEVLDADAFEAFKESGDIFNPTIGASFRNNILKNGGTKDAMGMYFSFRGKQPAIEPLLNKRGLN